MQPLILVLIVLILVGVFYWYSKSKTASGGTSTSKVMVDGLYSIMYQDQYLQFTDNGLVLGTTGQLFTYASSVLYYGSTCLSGTPQEGHPVNGVIGTCIPVNVLPSGLIGSTDGSYYWYCNNNSIVWSSTKKTSFTLIVSNKSNAGGTCVNNSGCTSGQCWNGKCVSCEGTVPTCGLGYTATCLGTTSSTLLGGIFLGASSGSWTCTSLCSSLSCPANSENVCLYVDGKWKSSCKSKCQGVKPKTCGGVYETPECALTGGTYDWVCPTVTGCTVPTEIPSPTGYGTTTYEGGTMYYPSSGTGPWLYPVYSCSSKTWTYHKACNPMVSMSSCTGTAVCDDTTQYLWSCKKNSGGLDLCGTSSKPNQCPDEVCVNSYPCGSTGSAVESFKWVCPSKDDLTLCEYLQIYNLTQVSFPVYQSTQTQEIIVDNNNVPIYPTVLNGRACSTVKGYGTNISYTDLPIISNPTGSIVEIGPTNYFILQGQEGPGFVSYTNYIGNLPVIVLSKSPCINGTLTLNTSNLSCPQGQSIPIELDIGYGSCSCNTGYSGLVCDINTATACGTYGTWTNSACSCETGYAGTFCTYDQSYCNNNGLPVNVNNSVVCTCNSGYMGDTCSVLTTSVCTNNGNLVNVTDTSLYNPANLFIYNGSTSYCDCNTGYYGLTCASYSFCNNGYLQKEPNSATASCSCYMGYAGGDCTENVGGTWVLNTMDIKGTLQNGNIAGNSYFYSIGQGIGIQSVTNVSGAEYATFSINTYQVNGLVANTQYMYVVSSSNDYQSNYSLFNVSGSKVKDFVPKERLVNYNVFSLGGTFISLDVVAPSNVSSGLMKNYDVYRDVGIDPTLPSFYRFIQNLESNFTLVVNRIGSELKRWTCDHLYGAEVVEDVLYVCYLSGSLKKLDWYDGKTWKSMNVGNSYRRFSSFEGNLVAMLDFEGLLYIFDPQTREVHPTVHEVTNSKNSKIVSAGKEYPYYNTVSKFVKTSYSNGQMFGLLYTDIGNWYSSIPSYWYGGVPPTEVVYVNKDNGAWWNTFITVCTGYKWSTTLNKYVFTWDIITQLNTLDQFSTHENEARKATLNVSMFKVFKDKNGDFRGICSGTVISTGTSDSLQIPNSNAYFLLNNSSKVPGNTWIFSLSF